MTASTTRTRKTTTGGPREVKGMRGSVGIGPLPRRGPRADHRCTPSSARFQHPSALPFPLPSLLPRPGYRPRARDIGMQIMPVHASRLIHRALSQITNLDYDFDPLGIKRKNKIKERSRVTRRKREREGGWEQKEQRRRRTRHGTGEEMNS